MIRMMPENLEKFINDVFVSAGLSEEQASIGACKMAFADSQGTDTHGILRLPIYVKRIQMGLYNKSPKVECVKETGNSAVIDGDNALGHYSTFKAMKVAIEKAKNNAISIVNLTNGNHFGAAAAYSKMAADEGMIGFITSNTAPVMAPTGSAERVLGNNPFSVAIPRKDDYPVILDVACSNVSGGKIILAHKKGESIPLGWTIDKQGKPTTDPFEGFVNGGALLPFAGHKGYGISLMMDVLAGILSGSNYGKNVGMVYDTTKVAGVGCCIIVINIENFMPIDMFNQRIEDLLASIKNSTKAEGIDEI